MSAFKTRSEIAAANELIEYLELLRSGAVDGTDGGVVGTQGINRALERLAENDNALLEALQPARFPAQLMDGGTVEFDTGFLQWDSAFTLMIVGQVNNKVTNSIAAGNMPGIVDNDVLYVVLDRTTEGAVLTLNKTDIFTYIGTTLPAAGDARLDYLVIAFKSANGLTFCNGMRLRDGYEYQLNFFRDTQYGQQTELTLVHDNQIQNQGIALTGGGDISWDKDSGELIFSDFLRIEFPSGLITASGSTNSISPATHTIAFNEVMYVTLDRTPSGSPPGGPFIVTNGNVPVGDDVYIIARRSPVDDRIYLADGTALSSGETVKLGGVRTGVQWFYQENGTAGQVTDFGVNNSYRVGGGELMVYRNGIKAKASKAIYRGEYGVNGSLDVLTKGDIEDDDDYIEEDNNGVPAPDQGHRIIWIRDTDSPLTVPMTWSESDIGTYRPEATHDPPVEWPGVDDSIEAFVGVQAQAPTINVPNGIYGFEKVWSQAADTIRTAGGTVAFQGAQYKNDGSTPLELVLDGTDSPDQLVAGDGPLALDEWVFIYLGVEPATGNVSIQIGTQPPDDSGGGAGVHPSDASLFFLTSAFLIDYSRFWPFVKTGSWVQLDSGGHNGSVGGLFTNVTSNPGTWQSVNIGAALPATFEGRARIFFQAVSSSVGDGNRVLLDWRAPGTSYPGLGTYAIMPANSDSLVYEFDAICYNGIFDARLETGATFDGTDDSYIRGYSEGRATSGDTLGD